MIQLSIFDVLSASKVKSQSGTYFVFAKDGYKLTTLRWLKLAPVYGHPKYGYRNLRDGWGLMQPDYVGAHWGPVTAAEGAALDEAHAEGDMEAIDNIINAHYPHVWKWKKLRETRGSEKHVGEAVAPGGMKVTLKKVPGRKAKWIYAFDIHSPDGRLFCSQELGLWSGMLFFGTVDIAQRHLSGELNWRINDTLQKFGDADSGKDFGPDRSWDRSTDPLLLARKIVYAIRNQLGKPLEPDEMKRLMELNALRKSTGRFDEDRFRDLSLDHLFAELFVRYMVSGMEEEDVWGDGPEEWTDMGRRWCKGAYAVQLGASNNKGSTGRYVIARHKVGNGPQLAGLFKDPQTAMDKVNREIFEKDFFERNNHANADFGDLKAKMMAVSQKWGEPTSSDMPIGEMPKAA